MLNTGNCGMRHKSWQSQKAISLLCLKLREKNKTVKEKRSTEIKIAGRCPMQGVLRRPFYYLANEFFICFKNLSAIGVKL